MRFNLKNILLISGSILLIIAIVLVIISLGLISQAQELEESRESPQRGITANEDNGCPIENCFTKAHLELPEDVATEMSNREMVITIMGHDTEILQIDFSQEQFQDRIVRFKLNGEREDHVFLPFSSQELLFVNEIIVRDVELEIEYNLDIETVESQANFPNNPLCPEVCETILIVVS